MRGEGIFLWGLGQYNLATAMATSINVDTTIKWNQYVYLALEEDRKKKMEHNLEMRLRREANYQALKARIRDKPDQVDLMRGDAMNRVLEDLIDPRLSSTNFRLYPVPIAGETIRKIPFQLPKRNATFSMQRFDVKSSWPLSLRRPEFAKERKACERAIDDAINDDVEGKLSSKAVEKIMSAVTDLQNKLDQTIPKSQKTDYVQAQNQIKALADIPRMLKEQWVEKVIAAIETYPGTTVGELAQFMQKYDLRFGVADSPTERELYAALHESMRVQREKITLPPDPDDEKPKR
jgi:hypothetical protein